MKRIILALTIVFIAMGLIMTACKKESPVGAVGYPMEGDFPEQDTFVPPTAKYYFYGLFDGQYKMWQDSLRSRWDTVTKICGPDDDTWDKCDPYNLSIYYNFASEGVADDTCQLDTNGEFYYHRTRFIRPEIADRRLDIYFYGCVNYFDTNNIYYPENQLGVLRVGAYPFSNPEYGRDGVEVIYTDEFRDEWKTEPGSGQLDDTYFRLTDLYAKPLADSTDTFGIFIGEGQFAGRLFHENSNAEIIVKDAKFRVRLVPRPEIP